MRFFPLLLTLALATPALAQEAAPAAKKSDPDRKICRSVMATGTILGGKRECRTRSEWAKLDDASRTDRENRSRNRDGGMERSSQM